MSRKQGIAVAFKTVATLLMSLWSATSQATMELYYVHTDHLGTPQVMTDKNQDVVWKRSQTPFGETVEETGTLDQPLRFPGQYEDLETGFYYNYYRDYDPGLGRYVQSDPIGLAGGLNTYSYVSNNSFRYIDPLGLDQMNRSPYAPGGRLNPSTGDGTSAGISLDLGTTRFSIDGKTGKIVATPLAPGSLAFSFDVCKPTKPPLECTGESSPSMDQTGAEISPSVFKVVTFGGNKDAQCVSVGAGFNFGVQGNVLGPPIELN